MRQVLVLNADFTPFKLISWQKAMIQILTDDKTGAYAVEYYDWSVKDGRGRDHKVPAVIALKQYVNVADSQASYTKTNVYFRDGMVCQYCGQTFSRGQLTIDHVVPRSRWDMIGDGTKVSSFENTVTACSECNSRKDNKTCSEAKMFPINKPVSITVRENFKNRVRFLNKRIPKQWKPYLKGMISEQDQ